MSAEEAILAETTETTATETDTNVETVPEAPLPRPEPKVHTTEEDEATVTNADAAETDGDFEPSPIRPPAAGPITLATEADGAPIEPVRLVEAALFTAGRPVSLSEICEATGLERRKADRAMKALAMEYEDRGDDCAIEVAMAGDKWAMQLKTRFVVHTQKLADMEIPKKTLKTLALIAFHQPVLQSDVVDMVGSKTYDHVRELHEHGLIRLKPEGLSKRIVTSPDFPEYFGIPATDTEKIRTYLAAKVGLTLTTKKGDKRLGEYEGKEGEANGAPDAEPSPEENAASAEPEDVLDAVEAAVAEATGMKDASDDTGDDPEVANEA